MKKLSIFLASFLFAYEITPYIFSVKENYKEYYQGKVIDRDYNSFFDMKGVGVKAVFKNGSLINSLVFEYASGDSTYDGMTQDGTKLRVSQNGVKIINLGYEIRYRNFPLSPIIGYRLWKRGKSNYEGDYNEDYKWPYLGAKMRWDFIFYNVKFSPSFTYQKAINPQLKIYIGNNPNIALGDTDGYNLELPLYVRYKNYQFFAFYRYQYWHISASDPSLIVIDNQAIPIYEPESKTKNEYVGMGISFKF